MILFTILFCSWQETVAQNFITRWNLATTGSGATQLSIGVVTVIDGTVNYNWQQVSSPGTASGSGSWSGSTLLITGLPTGSIIRLQIEPTNFQRININNGLDRSRLVDVEQWGTTVWTSMANAFYSCSNLQISATDFPNLTMVNTMSRMFRSCSNLNSPSNIGMWNTESVTNMSEMFREADAFNQNIGMWNTENVTDMSSMFYGTNDFNQNIGSWDTGKVTDMSTMFRQAGDFNQNIGSWDTGKVTDMSFMFQQANAFNQNIGLWNTALVTNMNSMFDNINSFNQNIGGWNTASVTNMSSMFGNTNAFNQNITSWNTTSVTNMSSMFRNATAFNQNISSWNTAAVTNMSSMFRDASAFNQDIGDWDLDATLNMTMMLNNCGMNCDNYSATLNGWNANSNTPNNISLGATGRQYSSIAQASRNNLTTVKGWTITDDAQLTSTPILVGSGQSITAVSVCGENTMFNPINPTQNIIDYNKNGNTFTPTTVTVNNQGSLSGGGGTFTNSATDYYQSTDETNTLRVSKRMHSIEALGSYLVNGGVIVRVYYSSTQNDPMTSDAWPGGSPPISSSWFKCSGHTAQSVVNDMTPTLLNNAVPITPTGSGTESGISYVEFTVTEFSTFVFVAKTGSLLPVDLLSFTARCHKQKVTLDWKTATEINNDFFTIDRSSDGKNWDMIGKVNGMGNSDRNQYYSFEDESPLTGKSYYRLKQTDFDGQDTYFKIISTSCGGHGEFSISPNPSASGTFTITGPEQNSDVVIMDALGKIIFETKIKEGETTIDLSNHVSGIYMVSVRSEFGISSKKIVISK